MTVQGSGRRPLRVGLVLPLTERELNGRTARWADLRAAALQAETIGFDSLWLTDHLLFVLGQRLPFPHLRKRLGLTLRLGAWESWTMLAALAAMTTRVELGTLVSCTSFRNPALFAKMADTLDEVSGGRLVLGLGAGWHQPEFEAFGYPFDHRVGRFEEALTIICTLLRSRRIDFDGTYYQVRECELRPDGPRPDGPPIMIGGTGKRLLRLTAQYADDWNAWLVFGRSRPEQLAPTLANVDDACAAAGRDPSTLSRSAAVRVVTPSVRRSRSSRIRDLAARGLGVAPVPLCGPPEMIAEGLLRFAAIGVSHVQVSLDGELRPALDDFARILEILDRGNLVEDRTDAMRKGC